MKLKDMFTSDFETTDNNEVSALRTRYYRIRALQAVDAVKQVAKNEGLRVTGVTSRNEVTIECMKYFAIVTIVETHPMECAIDIKISTNHGVLDFGRGPKYIKKLYDELDKLLPFKGVGLFK